MVCIEVHVLLILVNTLKWRSDEITSLLACVLAYKPQRRADILRAALQEAMPGVAVKLSAAPIALLHSPLYASDAARARNDD